MAPIVT